MDKLRIGWEEWLALPELGIPAIKAKVDTGAKTSALHAFLIEAFEEDGRSMVRFGVHPLPERTDVAIYCKARLVDQREVVSSNGQAETRYIISTDLGISGKTWPIEISLTNRAAMSYRMLLGRAAMNGRVLVDPEISCATGAVDEAAYEGLAASGVTDTGLRIMVLAAGYDTGLRSLVTEGRRRGHDVEVINPRDGRLEIAGVGTDGQVTMLLRDGEPVETPDAIIPWVDPAHYSDMSFVCAVLRHFEGQGVPTLNGAEGLRRIGDRMELMQLLSSHGIAMRADTDCSDEAGRIMTSLVMDGKATITAGASPRLVQAERRALVRIARLIGLGFAEIDFLRTAHGAGAGIAVVRLRPVAQESLVADKDHKFAARTLDILETRALPLAILRYSAASDLSAAKSSV